MAMAKLKPACYFYRVHRPWRPDISKCRGHPNSGVREQVFTRQQILPPPHRPPLGQLGQQA